MNTFFASNLSSLGTVILLHSVPLMSRRRSAHDVFETFATHASLVAGITDSDTCIGHKMAALLVMFWGLFDVDFRQTGPEKLCFYTDVDLLKSFVSQQEVIFLCCQQRSHVCTRFQCFVVLLFSVSSLYMHTDG